MQHITGVLVCRAADKLLSIACFRCKCGDVVEAAFYAAQAPSSTDALPRGCQGWIVGHVAPLSNMMVVQTSMHPSS